MSSVHELLLRARKAARVLPTVPSETRNNALRAMAQSLSSDRAKILAANKEDLDKATDLEPSLRDRLSLNTSRFEGMVRALEEVCALPDPLQSSRELGKGRSGIRVTRRRIPLGVIAIVYEARPNVTAECSALTVKSGNAVVLRGGKEAKRSNTVIATAMQRGLREAGLPEDAVTLIENAGREAVAELLGATGLVDLVIPRGGQGLMAMVDQHARVPVIRHGQGICHVYVDKDADPTMAIDIAFNAKVQRPGVCNAMETLLIHKDKLESVLKPLGKKLAQKEVEIHADEKSLHTLGEAGIHAIPAGEAAWDTEFLGLSMAVRTVDDLQEALHHIGEHGTHHTASIVTGDEKTAERFLAAVDASCVLWNASTRFNDGGELGLGAEMGISTSRMHAYGPMSMTELTTEKLVVYGTGQIRS